MSSHTRLIQLLQFLSQDPNDTFINYALGIEYIAMDDATKAAQYFEKTISLDANYIAAYYQSGKLFESTNVEKAKQFYERGMAVAEKLKRPKDLNELREALEMLEP